MAQGVVLSLLEGSLIPGLIFAPFFLGLIAVLFAAALIHREVKRTAGSSYLPGIQCNRFAANFLGIYYIWKHRDNPIIAATYGTIGACHIFQEEGIFRIWRGPRSLVALCNAETAEAFLNRKDNNAKAEEYAYLKPWLKDGLLLSTGEKWRARRRMLTPSFHFRILEQFHETMNKYSKALADVVEEKSKTEWIHVNNYISRCTLDILCENIMGVTIDSLHDDNCKYLKALSVLKTAVFRRMIIPLYWFDFIYYITPRGRKYKSNLKYTYDFNKEVIENRKREILENRDLYEHLKSSLKIDQLNAYKTDRPFLDTLLAHHIFNNDISEDGIEEEVSTFMFEGHDTTSAGLTAVFFFLGTHPEVQEKVQAEVDQVFGDDKNRMLTVEDLKQLKYTDMVIKESLRIMPPVPLIARKVKEKLILNGYELPSRCSAGVVIPGIHLNEKYYPQPWRFNPENFSPEKCAARHPYAYIPFSGGPRNCIGQRFAQMEEKIVTATLMSRLNVKSRYRFDELIFCPETVFQTNPPISVKFTPRNCII